MVYLFLLNRSSAREFEIGIWVGGYPSIDGHDPPDEGYNTYFRQEPKKSRFDGLRVSGETAKPLSVSYWLVYVKLHLDYSSVESLT